MGDRRLRQDAVAQIEDERPLPDRRKNPVGLPRQRLAARQQQDRIEIALEGQMRLELGRSPGERQPAIEAQRRGLALPREIAIEQAPHPGGTG